MNVTPVDPRRRRVHRLIHAHATDHSLIVQSVNTEDGITDEIEGPLNPAHTEFCLTRATALHEGLADKKDGLCRETDIDNLLFVAQHARDISAMRKWPFTHQILDMETMIRLPWFFIASEMRTGKSKIVADAAQFMFLSHMIQRVIVVAPAPVRDVWYDRGFGQIAVNRFEGLPVSVTEYHTQARAWAADRKPRNLEWFVTNFEWLRGKNWEELIGWCGPQTLLVGDESSYLNSYDAKQTEAFASLRSLCGRVVLLNGTPIFHSPLNLFSQGNILHSSILECRYITHYKARYAVEQPVLRGDGSEMMSPWPKKVNGKLVNVPLTSVVGWTNLEDLQERFAPCTVRRMQADCLDLPPKLDPVTLTAVLSPATWKAYKAMRDEMVVWLQSGDVAVTTTAATKVMRLAQITSGYLGGIEDAMVEDEPMEDWLMGELDENSLGSTLGVGSVRSDHRPILQIQEIGREKLDVLLWFLKQRLEEDENFKVVTWHRFQPELFRNLEAVSKAFPAFETSALCGGQGVVDRRRALALLKPETAPKGPVFVAGTEGTGSFGLDFTAAHTSVSISYGYSPGKHKQKSDRIYGPGQTEPIAFFDIVATGPKGQKTIDHHILAARQAGEDLATWTAEAWIRKLTEEL